MRLYTLVQLLEAAIFAVVLLYGLATPYTSLAALGGGLLVGLAVLNILAPEGGTVVRRSLVGYALGALFAVVAVALLVRHGA